MTKNKPNSKLKIIIYSTVIALLLGAIVGFLEWYSLELGVEKCIEEMKNRPDYNGLMLGCFNPISAWKSTYMVSLFFSIPTLIVSGIIVLIISLTKK